MDLFSILDDNYQRDDQGYEHRQGDGGFNRKEKHEKRDRNQRLPKADC